MTFVTALAGLISAHATPAAARPPHQQRALAAVESLWVAGQVDSCWTLLETEIAAARAARDSSYLLELLVLRGSGRARLGLVVAAEPDLREAIPLAEELGAGPRLRHCLRWLGFSLYRLGQSQEAGTCWTRA